MIDTGAKPSPRTPHPEADLHTGAPDGPAVIRLASASSWVSATASLITAYRGRPSPTLLQCYGRRRLSRSGEQLFLAILDRTDAARLLAIRPRRGADTMRKYKKSLPCPFYGIGEGVRRGHLHIQEK